MTKKRHFLVEPGFSEPTDIYEVTYRKVVSIKRATVNQVAETLERLGATNIIVDVVNPDFIDRIKLRFFIKKLFRWQSKEK